MIIDKKVMKKIIYILCLPIFHIAYGQVAIGNSPSFVTANGVLDLSTETNPIILPNISSRPANAVEGTLIFDNSTNKIEYKNDSSWVELTLNAGNKNTPTAALLHTTEPEGVIIGSNLSQAPGVLVLEKNNLGLVLPRNPLPTSISKPTSGSLIYDNSKNMLAVYNGTEWSFWEVPLVITQSNLVVTKGTQINQNISIPYTGGKGTSYPSGNVTQNGLTLSYPAGVLAGSGTINVQLSGNPNLPGIIIFKINEGNQPFDMIKITVN
ncbi:hypothetical protein H9Q08_19675 [Chryseobacterium sp. PS-8]|uniref:Uncharacterized protein n=1 Tax=Chryseobacterium indicum TaxID=2766954 RepID=A0ABS9CCT2_9FLAO|nr:hypothetical protein [Chryseobacterium sp. PS-8]MCF2221489.1 hypothetical protein [Chryseobacterium sp. PS-8]